jgi:hypothetical protein
MPILKHEAATRTLIMVDCRQMAAEMIIIRATDGKTRRQDKQNKN